jgi:hypothetical protein
MRTLDAAYEATLTQVPRQAAYKVEVYWGGAWRDITADVASIQIAHPEEARPAEARLTIASDEGKYDPVRTYAVKWSADYAGYLVPGAELRISLGGVAGGTTYLYQVFRGYIINGGTRYQRKEAETAEVQAFDRSYKWQAIEVNASDVYANQTTTAIIKDLFVEYAGLVDPADFNLTDLVAGGYEIYRLQFVEESLMDCGRRLVQPKDHRLYCDWDGRLRNRAPSPSKPAFDYAYTGAWVEWIGYDWRPPQVNWVSVLGRAMEPVLQVGSEVEWAKAKGFLPHGDPKGLLVPFPSGRMFVQNRIKWPPYFPTNPGAYNDIRWILFYENEKEAKFRLWSPGSTSYTLGILGKEASYVTPRVSGIAQDDASIAQWGRLPLEIDNPCVQTDSDAQWLADTLLERGSWYEKEPRIRTPMNLKHELGDTVKVSNPRSGTDMYLYVRSITHHVERGQPAVTEMGCLLEE